MTEHKHAWFFRALADGASIEDFETTHCSYDPDSWVCAALVLRYICTSPDGWEVRRKTRTHTVNGYDVSAPETEAPEVGTNYWYASPAFSSWAGSSQWCCASFDEWLLKRGLLHLNKEAAVANSKAMCGIDPHMKEPA